MSEAVKEKLAEMDATYQAERQQLLNQIAEDEQKQQAAAVKMAERLQLDRAEKRLQAIVSHFDKVLRPEYEERMVRVAGGCVSYREQIESHVNALFTLIEALPALQTSIANVLEGAVNDAYVRYASEFEDRDRAWVAAQNFVNDELAGDHDLRTAVAILPVINRLCDLRLVEGVTSVRSQQYGKLPYEMQGIDVTGIADSWIVE